MFRSAALLLCSLWLAPAAFAQGAKLQCNGPAGGHTGAQQVCRALSPLVATKSFDVQLELTKDEPSILAGRLIWTIGGARSRGPVVEVTASDRPLDARAARRLAQGLVATTDLP